jgi:hypothetical protein
MVILQLFQSNNLIARQAGFYGKSAIDRAINTYEIRMTNLGIRIIVDVCHIFVTEV